MHFLMNEWVGVWMNNRADEWMNACDGCMGRWINRQINKNNGSISGRMNVWVNKHAQGRVGKWVCGCQNG